MYKSRVVTVLIASPGDVAERNVVAEVIEHWNRGNRKSNPHVTLVALRWEADVPFIQGTDAQGVIDQWIVDTADIGVVIFWKTLGQGNTKHEMDRLLQARKKVLVYQCTREPRAKRDQSLRTLLSHCRDGGIVRDYSDATDLWKQVSADLSMVTQDVLRENSSEYMRLGRWLQIKDGNPTRPYALIDLSKKKDGDYDIRGVSFQKEGEAGFSWPSGEGRVFEHGEKELIHIYVADCAGKAVNGATSYDFDRRCGYYYQSIGSKELDSTRVNFRIDFIDDDTWRYLKGDAEVGYPSDRAFVRTFHSNRLHPRVILTGGTSVSREALISRLKKKNQNLIVQRSQDADIESLERAFESENQSEQETKTKLAAQGKRIFAWDGIDRTSPSPESAETGRSAALMEMSAIDGLAHYASSKKRPIETLRDEDPILGTLKAYSHILRRFTYRVLILGYLPSNTPDNLPSNPPDRESRERSPELSDYLFNIYKSLGFHCRGLPDTDPGDAKSIEQCVDTILKELKEASQWEGRR